MKYFIKTYGCQMNYSDSERIAAVLESAGYQKTSLENEANLIVINACSVRKSAVDRIAGNFKKYRKYKKKNPKLKIILTGCVLENDKERFEKLFDLVVDIKKINKLLEKIKNCHSEFISESVIDFKKNNSMQNNQKISEIKLEKNPIQQKILKQVQNDSNSNNNYFQIQPKYQSKFTAYLPIMTGCNNFCSYCVVPYTRGQEYSRPVEEILNEITELVKKGYKEVILLGQNVNSYESRIKNQKLRNSNNVSERANSNNNSNQTNWIPASAGMTGVVTFPKLLKLINNVPGNFWIRFLTSHPKDMTEELIKTVAECEKVTPYIHIALQSGDDEILKKMNRKYTAGHFLNLVKMIRKYIPNVAITTDTIVGFPTETEKQFQNTVKVMRKAKFDMAYINKYSSRAGTASAKLDDDVSWEDKKRREKILTEILKETALENNKKYVRRVVDMLINKIDDDSIYGKTKSFKNVKVELRIKNQELRIKEGNFIKIKIAQANAWGLEGKIVE